MCKCWSILGGVFLGIGKGKSVFAKLSGGWLRYEN